MVRHVRSPVPARTAIVVAGFLLASGLPTPASGQGVTEGRVPPGASVSVDVRPTRVRIGDRIVVNLRIQAPAAADVLVEELVLPEGVAVLDVRDRSSLALGTASGSVSVRDVVWILSSDVPGPLELPPVRVWFGDQPTDHAPGSVEILDAPLRRQAQARGLVTRSRRQEPPVLPQGTPPPTGGEERGVIPGGRPAGTGLVITVPGGVQARPRTGAPGVLPPGVVPPTGLPGVAPGRAPGGITTGSASPSSGWSSGVPGGWAESAHQDPWWDELIPRVQEWSTVVQDPTGWVELSAGVSPPRVYVGQQITYLAAAGFAPEAGYRMDADPEYFAPAPQDVWRVDVPRIGPGFLGASAGNLQDVRPFLQAFFPLRPGTVTIPGARLAYSLGGSGGLGPRDSLVTEPVAVEVLPIPVASAPAGYDGAVGRYAMGVTLDREALGPGETGVLTVTVRGAGNVEGISLPRPTNLQGVVLRPLGERAVVETRDGVVGGVKVFQWLVSVAEPGLVSLGPFLLTYFDPWVGDFQITATREIVLEGIGEASPGR